MLSTRRCLGIALCGFSVLAAGTAPAAVRAPRPARVAISPDAATLQPGETLRLDASAFDRQGNPIDGVSFTWTSSKQTILALGAPGTASVLATAGKAGTATVTARGGGKTARINVTVAGPSPIGGAFTAAGLGPVNHVVVDDEWVYWTEASNKLTRVRKARKAGGPIFDVAKEPFRDRRGVLVSYVHLQRIGDTLYWARQTVGFAQHWSIRCVSTEGGEVREILPEDVSVEPLLTHAWRVSGRHVVAVLEHPERIGLGGDTRVAAFDTDARTWAPLLTGRFRVGQTEVLAVDDLAVYLRGINPDGHTEILKISPAAPANAVELLGSETFPDRALGQHGVSDGNRLYYWSRRGEADHEIRSLPVTGGGPTTLVRGKLGFGLATDGVHLYWLRDPAAVAKVPVGGGAVTTLTANAPLLSVAGGLALDASDLFLPTSLTRVITGIVRLPR